VLERFQNEGDWFVKQRVVMAVAVLEMMLLTTGCQSLFVSNQKTMLSRWKTWADITTAFNKIQPNRTTLRDLQNLGFDPAVSPNIKIMPYIDIVPLFMPNPNIRLKDPPAGVQLYVEARQGNCTYLVEIENLVSSPMLACES
jgi:hypothetical protein